MSRLFAATIVRQNRDLLRPPTAAYLNPLWIKSAIAGTYIDAAGATDAGTDITYLMGYDKSYERFYQTVEPASTIVSRINTANTTNPAGLIIPVTVVNQDGTTSAESLNTEDILYAQNHPADNTDCLVLVNTPMLDRVRNLRIDGTAATLAASANA